MKEHRTIKAQNLIPKDSAGPIPKLFITGGIKMIVMQREGTGKMGINKLKVNEMPIIFVMDNTTEFQVKEGPNNSLEILKDGKTGIIIKPEVSNIIRIK